MSGQEVSQDKTSILFSKNVNMSMQTKLQQLSKFRSTKIFGKYLRVQLSGKKLKSNDFQYIMEKVAAKLNCWKKNSPRLLGELRWPKSVIEAIPLYLMMTNKLPKFCIDSIHGLHMRFSLRKDVAKTIPIMMKTGMWVVVDEELSEAKVCDLVTESGEWNFRTSNDKFLVKEMFKEIEGYNLDNADGDWKKYGKLQF
ncbi:unnamed protein product [Vicia faba]|uniref:Uncharacterized protein n=1 Tax=Vicia faba TaxID=3906 RepID=A0AAV1AUM0_VICFA|nr:unnamed protein product [Vicia faba]